MGSTPPNPFDTQAALKAKLDSHDRWHIRLRRTGTLTGLVVVALALALILNAVVGTSTPGLRVVRTGRFVLAPSPGGCTGVVGIATGGFQVPITFSRSGTAAVMSANVCINGDGPFPSSSTAALLGLSSTNRSHGDLGLPPRGGPKTSTGWAAAFRLNR